MRLEKGVIVGSKSGQEGRVLRVDEKEGFFIVVFNKGNVSQIEYYSIATCKFIGKSAVEARQNLKKESGFIRNPFQW